MLRESISFLLIRSFPEGMFMFLSASILLNMKMDIKKIIVQGFLFAIAGYFIRMLPINFGVHTIFAILIFMAMLCKLNNVDTFVSIKTGLIIAILSFISDISIILIYLGVLGLSENILFSRSAIGALISLPGLIIFISLTYLFRFVVNNKYKKINEEDTKDLKEV